MKVRGLKPHRVGHAPTLGQVLHRAWDRAACLATALCLAAAGVVQAAPAAAPALDAVVTTETKVVTAAGVMRTEVWQEKVVRRGDTVWTERILPPQAKDAHQHESKQEHAGHKHFDAEAAARWVQLDAKGQTVLRFVDRAHRMVVSVPKSEYEAVGFDGRFDAVAHIVPPSVIERMPVLASASKDASAVWHVEKNGQWSHRVLWSTQKQVALRIESERLDGGFKRVVTVEPVAAAAALPWDGLSSYVQKEYDDFMD
jgi:hypothetical protein